MNDGYDERDASITSAARSAWKAARSLAEESVSSAERRCFESLADRIQMGILAAKGDPDELIGVGPAGNGLTLVEMLLVDERVDTFELARVILRQWFWPRDLQASGDPAPRRASGPSRHFLSAD